MTRAPAASARAARRTAPAVTAAAALAALASALPAAAAPSPGPDAAHGAQGVKAIDTGDPDLALREGAHLATPKVLPLEAPRLAIDLLVESVPPGQAPGPQPGTPATRTPATPGTRPGRQDHETDSTPTPGAESTQDTPSRPATDPATSRPAEDVPAAAQEPSALTGLIGGGYLAAAAVTAALALRRTRRNRTTPPAAPATANTPADTDAPDAQAADTAATGRLDIALRALAHHARQAGQPLPGLRAARIIGDTIEVLPDDAAVPPAGFATGADGWWVLPAGADQAAAGTGSDAVGAPYPALTAIGTTADGSLLLLDLARHPVIALDGDTDAVLAACRSLLLEHALSPCAGTARLITAGFAQDLAPLLPTARITATNDLDDALHELSEHLLEAAQLPSPEQQPCLLISTRPLDPQAAARLTALLAAPGRPPITVIASAGSTGEVFPDALVLDAAADEAQHVEAVGCDVVLQRIDDDAYQHVIRTLEARASTSSDPSNLPSATTRTTGRTPAPPSAGSDSASGAPADAVSSSVHPSHHPDQGVGTGADTSAGGVFPSLLAAASTRTPQPRRRPSPTTSADPGNSGPGAQPGRTGDPYAPEIRVLGPLEVDRVPDTGHGPRAAQLAALLYFHPHHNADTLCTAMDPHHAWGISTLNARLNGLRRHLGDAPDNTPYVPRRRHGDDPYRLHPAIRCDHTRFQHLTHHAHNRGPDALPDLEHALTLVRGRPFGDRPPAWAEPLQQQMTTAIADTAHLVATHRTTPGPRQNLTAARHAVTTALEAGAHSERLYRTWMTIEHLDHNHAALHTVIDRLQHHSRQLGTPLEPETEHLIQQLLTPTRP
ncbi:bacterial transcriptional activator domain-containing protein [Streptomyces sp. NPDC006458]|uniref:AfsR/SARP family transcriptional regulator n=1 Tax=Streptomyces sp. NPDC006458 TaxID=3154302 RepID=UPI0033B97778